MLPGLFQEDYELVLGLSLPAPFSGPGPSWMPYGVKVGNRNLVGQSTSKLRNPGCIGLHKKQKPTER